MQGTWRKRDVGREGRIRREGKKGSKKREGDGEERKHALPPSRQVGLVLPGSSKAATARQHQAGSSVLLACGVGYQISF